MVECSNTLDDGATQRTYPGSQLLKSGLRFTLSRVESDGGRSFTMRRKPCLSVAAPKLIKSPTRRSVSRKYVST